MNPAALAPRVAAVRERIEQARQRAGSARPVTLVAVTKTHPARVVHAARQVGIGDVGENRVQELEQKVAEVGREGLRWHLIGHLQRNKVRAALPLFELLHSLDSLRLAEKLSQEAVATGREVRALVQVNTSGEASKFGFEAEAALDALGRICELPGLRIEGLMTMAPFTGAEAVLRATFAAARRLQEEAARQIPGFHDRELSMGMSNDFELGIEEGSTMVRLGTVLFGERDA